MTRKEIWNRYSKCLRLWADGHIYNNVFGKEYNPLTNEKIIYLNIPKFGKKRKII